MTSEATETDGATLLTWATSVLTEAGVGSPGHDAEALLAHVLGVARLRLGLGVTVSEADREAYEAVVERRRARVPLQHLVGTAAFRTVEVAVGPGVFVPRPETETVAGWAIDAALSAAGGTSSSAVVVDLCTGSGAIALAVAREVPAARVHAVELDPQAHRWAERNLAGSGVRLELGDAATAFADLDGTVDVVVANPPYIPLDAYDTVEVEARDHDPALALWSGTDGLDAIRMVERTAARLLRPDGVVGCEHADVQAASAPAVFSSTGRWRDVRDHLDLAGRSRFVTARRLP